MNSTEKIERYKSFKSSLMAEIGDILDEFIYSDGIAIKIELSKETVPSISYSVTNKYAFKARGQE